MIGHSLGGPPSSPPVLVAIVGGSGSGKSWLASRLKTRLGVLAGRLSLDDFYRDRSHLPLPRRASVNFDHPRAIDWPEFQKALQALCNGRPALVPRYDFKTHGRRGFTTLEPRRIWLLDGLWLLHKRSVRSLFKLSIFLDCPVARRLARRLQRDTRTRGRTSAAVRAQFEMAVQPMHERFVQPQRRWARIIVSGNCGAANLAALARQIKSLATDGGEGRRQSGVF